MIVKYPREKGGNKGVLQRSSLTSLLLISVKIQFTKSNQVDNRLTLPGFKLSYN